MAGTLSYLVGNALAPRVANTIIAQGNNSCGDWGAGFVVAVDKLSPVPKDMYLDWAKNGFFYTKDVACRPSLDVTKRQVPFQLGEIQLVKISDSPKQYIANMITQKNTGNFYHMIPLRYDSVRECFFRLFLAADKLSIDTVSMPRIGCGLAGGEWECVEELINQELIDNGINVDIYDLPPRQPNDGFVGRIDFKGKK
jgi:hypothetical protein